MLAVLTRVPVTPEASVPETVKVAVLPEGSDTRESISPVPEAEPQEPAGVQVQANPETGDGRTS